MPAGHSGTPLEKKLGIKEGFSVLLFDQPENYFKLFTSLPADLSIREKVGEEKIDFIHIFCTCFITLTEIASRYKNTQKKDGLLRVSWPKGTSSIKTDIKREPLREHLLSIGLVDVKVAAIDEDWSGLKFVHRLKDRK